MSDKLLGIAMYDKVRGFYCCFTFCNSKAEYIRSNVESAIRECKNLNDLVPTVLCTYDLYSGEIEPCKEVFEFSEYQMPTTKADALAPLGVNFAREALEFEQWRKEKEAKAKENVGK